MQENPLDEKVINLVLQLKDKYESVGEDLSAHLEGILYSDYTNYWDYVGIEALLNLQKPKTKYPDEMIFIIYHQITELYFKLIIHEMEQIGFNKELDSTFFVSKLERINQYFSHLFKSFDVLLGYMDTNQFLKFRTALTPSSGFQSIQYRLIEVWSTEFKNLVSKEARDQFSDDSPIESMYQYIYWKQGATDMATGKKTLTLIQFEDKYSNLIIRKGRELRDKNLLASFKRLSTQDQQSPELIQAMRQFDLHANINWPLTHFKYVVKYLKRGGQTAKSTGGTNWQEYLPPKFQKQVFYPHLWTAEEIDNWGKSWVEELFNEEK